MPEYTASEISAVCGVQPRRQDYAKTSEYKAALKSWNKCVKGMTNSGEPNFGSQVVEGLTAVGVAYVGGSGTGSGMPTGNKAPDTKNEQSTYTGNLGGGEGYFSRLLSWLKGLF